MASVGLVFAPLAPLVALAACIVFWMSSWVNKYQLMFVYTTKVETGGVSNNFTICRSTNFDKITAFVESRDQPTHVPCRLHASAVSFE